jgi:hypothetical protein
MKSFCFVFQKEALAFFAFQQGRQARCSFLKKRTKKFHSFGAATLLGYRREVWCFDAVRAMRRKAVGRAVSLLSRWVGIVVLCYCKSGSGASLGASFGRDCLTGKRLREELAASDRWQLRSGASWTLVGRDADGRHMCKLSGEALRAWLSLLWMAPVRGGLDRTP